MTDQDLLEAAAKAAGLPVEFDEGHVNGWWPLGRTTTGDVDEWWNPLTDDGDAFRLAVKLGMGLHYESQFFADRVERIVEVYHSHEDGQCQCMTVGYTDDPFAATRRAIVRAAAATLAPHP